MNNVRAASNWLRVGLRAIFYASLALTLGRLPGFSGLRTWCMLSWCSGCSDALGINRNLIHGHRLSTQTQAIFVSNHLSVLDVLVLGSYLNRDFRWLAKASLFKVPFMGWYLSAAGHIPVYRTTKSSRANTHIADAIHRAAQAGASVLIFPEGTRSKQGGLTPFKLGAFSAAVRESLPIVPVVIRGTHELMEKGSKDLSIRADRSCTVTVLPAVQVSAGGQGDETARATKLRDLVYSSMRCELGEYDAQEEVQHRESA